MPEPKIAAVLYDIGNVLIQWDPRHLYRRLIPDEAARDWFLREVCPPSWNLAQDAGRPWPAAIAEASARHPDHADLIAAFRGSWHEMVPGAVDDSVALYHAVIDTGLPVYGLTNFAADTFAETRARFPFLNRMRGILVSGEEGVVKPDPEIYRLACARFGLIPESTLFTDDSPANIAAAAAMGFRTHLFADADGLAEVLSDLGVIGDGCATARSSSSRRR